METIQSIWEFINSVPGLAIISSAVGLFAAIATVTPNEADNKILSYIYKGINLLGLNIGKAKNEE